MYDTLVRKLERLQEKERLAIRFAEKNDPVTYTELFKLRLAQIERALRSIGKTSEQMKFKEFRSVLDTPFARIHQYHLDISEVNLKKEKSKRIGKRAKHRVEDIISAVNSSGRDLASIDSQSAISGYSYLHSMTTDGNPLGSLDARNDLAMCDFIEMTNRNYTDWVK